MMRNGQMQFQNRGFSVRDIDFIKLKLCIVYLMYHIVKIKVCYANSTFYLNA